MSLTNNGGTVNITTIHVVFALGPGGSQQLRSIDLDGGSIWSGKDTSGDVTLTVSGTISSGSTSTLTVNFVNALESGGHSVTVSFDAGCSASGSYTQP